MYRTFNCGVGMVICVPAEHSEAAINLLKETDEDAWVIGHIDSASEGEEQVELVDAE